MFIEPSGTPSLLAIDTPPCEWVENGDAWAQANVRASVVGAWNAIPATIRTRLTRPIPGTNKRFRFLLGSTTTCYAVNPGPGAYGGLYIGDGDPTHVGPFALGVLPTSSSGAPWSVLVHEFGHHVDAYYHRLWGADLADKTSRSLTTSGPLTGLWVESSAAWAAWQAAAPADALNKSTSIYGFSNRLEWLAETFMFWLVDPGSANYDQHTQAGSLLILAGMSLERQARIRDAIVAFLPDMPPMPGLS